jgi:hypothetical protein
MRTRLILAILSLVAGVGAVQADVTVRISVKFILHPNGTRPSAADIGTIAGFNAELIRGNRVLTTTRRGIRLEVVEYVDIQPAPPPGRPADYWYNLDARSSRKVFETAALDDQVTWHWSEDAINVFVNDSSSGSCSFPAGGLSISLGSSIVSGTLLHELGHFFDLRHTHSAADSDGNLDDWGDGDGLAETLDDDPDATLADINARYPDETQQKRDDLFYNVMSYHVESRLLPRQMDTWSLNVNGSRSRFCNASIWFVAVDGSDSYPGNSAAFPFKTLTKALSRLTNGDDVIVLSSGVYNPPVSGVLDKPCTLTATRGAVDVIR